MAMNYTTVLLLQGILHYSPGKEEIPLQQVLGFFDYVNHSLPSYQEFKESMQWAVARELIEVRKGRLKPSANFKVWRESRPRQLSIQREGDEIAQLLALLPKQEEIAAHALVTESEFDDALAAYLRKKA
ncbi:hypothetical protein [Nibribacter koreensis]